MRVKIRGNAGSGSPVPLVYFALILSQADWFIPVSFRALCKNRQRRRVAGFVCGLSIRDQTSASESFSRGASSTERMAQRAMTSWVLAAPTAMVTVSSLSATTVP